MNDSGYFLLDRLPRHTALGYIKDETNQNWRTNAYSIPIKEGGADGRCICYCRHAEILGGTI